MNCIWFVFLLGLGAYKQAIDAFEYCRQASNSVLAVAHLALAICNMIELHKERALAEVSAFIRISPRVSANVGFYLRGYCHYLEGRLIEAEKDLKAALSTNSRGSFNPFPQTISSWGKRGPDSCKEINYSDFAALAGLRIPYEWTQSLFVAVVSAVGSSLLKKSFPREATARFEVAVTEAIRIRSTLDASLSDEVDLNVAISRSLRDQQLPSIRFNLAVSLLQDNNPTRAIDEFNGLVETTHESLAPVSAQWLPRFLYRCNIGMGAAYLMLARACEDTSTSVPMLRGCLEAWITAQDALESLSSSADSNDVSNKEAIDREIAAVSLWTSEVSSMLSTAMMEQPRQNESLLSSSLTPISSTSPFDENVELPGELNAMVPLESLDKDVFPVSNDSIGRSSSCIGEDEVPVLPAVQVYSDIVISPSLNSNPPPVSMDCSDKNIVINLIDQHINEDIIEASSSPRTAITEPPLIAAHPRQSSVMYVTSAVPTPIVVAPQIYKLESVEVIACQYSIATLLSPGPYPEGVKISSREKYLSDSDFYTTFSQSKEQFEMLPAWKQVCLALILVVSVLIFLKCLFAHEFLLSTFILIILTPACHSQHWLLCIKLPCQSLDDTIIGE